MSLFKTPFLFVPDPPEGGGGGEKPPVAEKIVNNPEVKETDAADLIKLRGELSDREKKLKERETRISELEDENRTLRTPPAPKPKPEPKEKEQFMKGEETGGFGFFRW